MAPLLDGIDTAVYKKYSKDTTGKLGQIASALAFSGLPLKDILDAIDSRKPVPTPKYSSSGEIALSDITNTTQGTRSALAGDLVRPVGYEKDGQVLGSELKGFGFSFPGKARIFTNATDCKGNIKTVLDNIDNLCGKAHVRQAQTVMNALSQSGIGDNMISLAKYGIKANEHTAVNFSFSRNDETGDVTIRYSSPEELPFSFEWTATISTDGNVTTTPLRFTD